jgi:DNA-binding IscR family transcriptional regulator
VLLRSFVNHGGLLGRSDLAGELGKSAAWTSKTVGVLKAEKLIRVNKGKAGGYRATPRFTKFLKKAVSNKELEG